jgi:hypothetical protein
MTDWRLLRFCRFSRVQLAAYEKLRVKLSCQHHIAFVIQIIEQYKVRTDSDLRCSLSSLSSNISREASRCCPRPSC